MSLEDVDEDVTTHQRWWAYLQLAAVFAVIAMALAASVLFGYVTLDLTVTATVDVGWIVEYLVMGIAAAFLLYVFALLLIALPGSIINAIGGIAYGIAEQQGYIDREDDNE